MKEKWKSFRKGHYKVSSLGRIVRVVTRGGNPFWKELTLMDNGRGYLYVCTCVGGVVKRHYVHTLVARKFIGKCPEGKEVNHKDLNKGNNNYKNLEYMTRKENINHAIDNGHKGGKSRPGESNPSAKLTKDEVLKIRRLYEKGVSQRKLAKRFCVSRFAIYAAIKKKTWAN